MWKVSKEAFYKPIYDKRLDVHPSIVTSFPYTSIWKFTRNGGTVYGKTVDVVEGGTVRTEYYLAD